MDAESTSRYHWRLVGSCKDDFLGWNLPFMDDMDDMDTTTGLCGRKEKGHQGIHGRQGREKRKREIIKSVKT